MFLPIRFFLGMALEGMSLGVLWLQDFRAGFQPLALSRLQSLAWVAVLPLHLVAASLIILNT